MSDLIIGWRNIAKASGLNANSLSCQHAQGQLAVRPQKLGHQVAMTLGQIEELKKSKEASANKRLPKDLTRALAAHELLKKLHVDYADKVLRKSDVCRLYVDALFATKDLIAHILHLRSAEIPSEELERIRHLLK